MKKTFLLAVTALVALMAASCQKEEQGRVLTATIEQYEHNADSKAYINADNYACWEAGDLVKINNTQCTIRFKEGSQGIANTAIIDGATLPTDQDLLAFYPASQVSSWNGNDVTISLPPIQTYEERNGHQIINNPMAAYCPVGSDELKFRNLAALLKVTIQAPNNEDLAVKAILVKGNDNQMLWGTAPLMLDNQNKPMLGEMSNGDATVSLGFDSPAEISANSSKSFYIVVPDGSSFKNFTIYVVTNQNEIYKKKTPLGHTLPRNHIGAISYTLVEDDEVYAILYTGSVGNFNQNAFGEGVNVLSADDGVIIFDNTITSIGNSAFFGCSSLTSIYLPAGATSIGDHAFDGCSGLTSIYLPAGVTSIGYDSFFGCSHLASISLPAGVTSIGEGAFWDCSSLTSISLPQSLTEIESDAFMFCSRLARVDCHPETPPSLEDNVFYEIPNSAVLHVPSGKADTYSDSPWGTVFSGEGRIIDDL